MKMTMRIFLIVNEDEKEQYRFQLIREWALEGGQLLMKKLDNLLKKISTVFVHISKSYKTPLSTPVNLEIRKFNDGSQMWYKDIRRNLNITQLEPYLHKYDRIIIDINIDGLPLFKSSKAKFWLILGYLTMTKNAPFIIAIYFGKTDPQDLDIYLGQYVNEIEDLLNNGYVFNNRRYRRFQIRHYICDAPARSFVKCCIDHCGYASCEKCTIIPEWIEDRVICINLDENLRTDYSFLQQTQPQYHKKSFYIGKDQYWNGITIPIG